MFYGYTLPQGTSYKQIGDFMEAGLGALGDRTLRRGMKGPDVTELQNKIIAYFAAKGVDAMPRFGADGDFGGEGETWVKKFQAEKGLSADGIAGQATFAALATAGKITASSKSTASVDTRTSSPSKSSSSVVAALKKGPPKAAIYAGVAGILGLVGFFAFMQTKKGKR